MTLLSPQEASRRLAQLGVSHSKSTLNRYRCIGGGPEFVEFRRTVRYPDDRLIAYAHRITSGLMAANHVPAQAVADTAIQRLAERDARAGERMTSAETASVAA